MEIYINNKLSELSLEDKSLQGIVDFADNYAKDRESVVMDIFIDETRISEIQDTFKEAFNRVEIFTQKASILLLESFQEMGSYLERLKIGINDIVDYLQVDEERDAMFLTTDAIDGLEWIHTVLKSAKSMGLIDYVEVGFEDIFEKFNSLMQEILGSLENRDNIMMSDLLNYELLPMLDTISSKLPDLYNIVLDKERASLKKIEE